MMRIGEHGRAVRDASGTSRGALRVAPMKHFDVNNRDERTRLMLDQYEPLHGYCRTVTANVCRVTD
jgi:hypothetical protein